MKSKFSHCLSLDFVQHASMQPLKCEHILGPQYASNEVIVLECLKLPPTPFRSQNSAHFIEQESVQGLNFFSITTGSFCVHS